MHVQKHRAVYLDIDGPKLLPRQEAEELESSFLLLIQRYLLMVKIFQIPQDGVQEWQVVMGTLFHSQRKWANAASKLITECLQPNDLVLWYRILIRLEARIFCYQASDRVGLLGTS